MVWQARIVGHTDPSDPDLVVSRPKQRRLCRRCGAQLFASNTESLCFPCQRTEFEALWLGGLPTRGRSVPSRWHAKTR
jgi:hypothetical protein